MADKERLLTVEEINELPINRLSGLPAPPVVAKAQLAKDEARIGALRLDILKEIAEDMKERFKPYAVIHGISYVPNSFIDLYISRLEMGTYKALKATHTSKKENV